MEKSDYILKIKEIRQAVADYIRSEGCSCCEGHSHGTDQRKLGKLLGAKKYKDGLDYDFQPFESPKQ